MARKFYWFVADDGASDCGATFKYFDTEQDALDYPEYYVGQNPGYTGSLFEIGPTPVAVYPPPE